MIDLKIIEKKGTEAVKKLRQRKLQNGNPFMINSKELLTNQCYLEFPDGSIKLATYSHSSKDFEILHILSFDEAQIIRNQFHLYR